MTTLLPHRFVRGSDRPWYICTACAKHEAHAVHHTAPRPEPAPCTCEACRGALCAVCAHSYSAHDCCPLRCADCAEDGSHNFVARKED